MTAKYGILAFTVLMLVGCDAGAEDCPQTTVAPNNLEFVESFTSTDQTCLPPCWQGLAPGHSTQADVEAALQKTSFIDEHSITMQSASEYSPLLVNWSMTGSQWSSVSGQAVFDDNGNLMSIIFVGDRNHPLGSLGGVIKTFGEPNAYSVIPSHDFSCKRDSLVWYDNGVGISTFPERSGEAGPHLETATAVNSITYFIPQQTMEGYLENVVGLPKNQVKDRLESYINWNGLSATGSSIDK